MTTCNKPECDDARQTLEIPAWGAWSGNDEVTVPRATHQASTLQTVPPARSGLQAYVPPKLSTLDPGPPIDVSKRRIGVAILTGLSIASIYAVITPSYTALRTSTTTPEARKQATKKLLIGFGVGSVAGAVLYWMFDDWIPATVAGITVIGLTTVGMYAIHSSPSGLPPAEVQG